LKWLEYGHLINGIHTKPPTSNVLRTMRLRVGQKSHPQPSPDNPSPDKPSTSSQSAADNKRFKCEKCNKTYSCLKSVRRHDNIDHQGNLFKCANCEKTFTRKRELKSHLSVKGRCNGGIMNFKCPHCNRT
jgi:transposase-like protein